MSDHATDVAKFTSSVNADAINAIVNYCGISLRSRDASMVSSEHNTSRVTFYYLLAEATGTLGKLVK